MFAKGPFQTAARKTCNLSQSVRFHCIVLIVLEDKTDGARDPRIFHGEDIGADPRDHAFGRDNQRLLGRPLAVHDLIQQLRTFIAALFQIIIHTGQRNGREVADERLVMAAQYRHLFRHPQSGIVTSTHHAQGDIVRSDGDGERFGHFGQGLDQPAVGSRVIHQRAMLAGLG